MKDYKVNGNVKRKIRVESDLGVLFLAEPLKYNTNVHSILMARRPPKKGNKASVTGWFDINNNFPENLHRYETKLIAASNNGISINISGSININDGGPLVVINRLVGVVSALHITCLGFERSSLTTISITIDCCCTNNKMQHSLIFVFYL